MMYYLLGFFVNIIILFLFICNIYLLEGKPNVFVRLFFGVLIPFIFIAPVYTGDLLNIIGVDNKVDNFLMLVLFFVEALLFLIVKGIWQRKR